MKSKNTLFIFILMLVCISVFSQNYYRSGIFLHHSTGNYIWGPNPDGNSTTTIPSQMHLYNVNHNYTTTDSITLAEEWWAPSDNEWSTQHEFFEGNTTYTDINYYLSNYKIIVIKSCFPSSQIDSWGQASDTTSPTTKSVYNYKWHWRHILKVMKNHPGNFFAIWTNAPLEVNSTNTTQADLARKFCKWAKDTLAKGLDPVFGAFPLNVYVFDYFSKVTGPDSIELTQDRTASGDSHPNGAATDLVAPQFVNEIFNVAIAYEQLTGITQHLEENSVSCYPNPFKNDVNFKFKLSQSSMIDLKVFDSKGKTVYEKNENTITPGEHLYNLDLSTFKKGVYYYSFSINEITYNGKLVRQ